MLPEIDFATAPWIRSRGVVDPNRPLDVPFTPYEESFCDRPVIEVIADVARRRPDHIAIDDGTVRLTYAQLYTMACQLSHGISRANLPSGPVGVKLRNVVFYLVAILGCVAAGRPCILLSQDNPPDYNRRLIGASGVQALLVNAAEVRSGSDDGGPPLIAIEPILMAVGGNTLSPAGRLGPDEAAFIVSTSGSTGVPKLIARSQRALHRRVSNNVLIAHYNENDRILTLAAPAIGAAISTRFLPLLIGATLYIVDVPRAGMGGILKTLRDSRITCMRTTASLMKALSKIDDASVHLTHLRLASGGGEVLLQKDLTWIREILPSNCRFMHSLGMTETAVARWFVPAKDEHDPIRVAAGYLSPGTDVLVLDEDGLPCPVGEIGELLVRSESAALGEWRDGKLLSDRFEKDPADPTKRIYRTGDMARVCADGVLVMHGRKDRMIKIRGQRVEPAVIEAAMRTVLGVADAAVVAKPEDGGFRLCGFVVPSAPDGNASNEQSGDALPAVVRAALETTLPPYMRPYDILVLDAVPINANNKVDSRVLLDRMAAFEGGQPTIAKTVAAQLAASRQSCEWVASAWYAAFGTDSRNLALSFEAAGGDSLRFMQIIFRLEQLCGMPVPLGIFDLTMSQDDMARSLDRHLRGDVGAQSLSKQIFLIPGVGGDEPRLLHFRAGCAPDLSFTCLDYGTWDQWVEKGFVLDSLVNQMIARIQEVAPSGPLCLAGYSLGGRIALVAAAELQAAGREIERLLILDSSAVTPQSAEGVQSIDDALPGMRNELREWRRAHRHNAGAFALALIVTRRLVKPRWQPLLRWIGRHRRKILLGRIDFYLSFYIHRLRLIQLAREWSRRLTAAPRISAPITIFRAGEGGISSDRSAAAWGKHSPAVTEVTVGGDHFTMFDPPHLTDLCVQFKTCAAGEDAGRSSVV